MFSKTAFISIILSSGVLSYKKSHHPVLTSFNSKKCYLFVLGVWWCFDSRVMFSLSCVPGSASKTRQIEMVVFAATQVKMFLFFSCSPLAALISF